MKAKIADVIYHLGLAYGGQSQYSLLDLGRALAGQRANNGLLGQPAEIADVAAEILAERWRDDREESDAREILRAIEVAE